MNFLNEVLEQKVAEVQEQMSLERMTLQEQLADRRKKHKIEIKRLMAEKVIYEERANSVIEQFREQMAQLQAVAMTRIEVINDLIF